MALSSDRRNVSAGAVLALVSALLFGASTPFAKLLLGQGVDPWLLAGLLYFSSGTGLGITLLLRGGLALLPSEAPLRSASLPWLSLVILAGGVAGPVLLMLGLERTSASATALLLNLEGLATVAIAWLVFNENVDRRILIGAFAILVGAALLSWQAGPTSIGWGAILVAGACLAWGIDNNLTRKLSGSDPVQIAAAKGLIAGTVNLVLAFAKGAAVPKLAALAVSAVVGLLGFGISLVLFVLALRHLGSARASAYFSTAPFVGAVLSILMFGEPITTRLVLATTLMSLGLYLHLAERHEHEHVHQVPDHEHSHVHDEHHRHVHGPDDPAGEPHSHWHHHAPLPHTHPHYPDLHHRHGHAGSTQWLA
jgi:drug/metabolite transporter (DMT)-like permease